MSAPAVGRRAVGSWAAGRVDAPAPVRRRAALLVQDLMAVMVLGRHAPAARLAAEHAAATSASGRATVLLGGTMLHPVGAAWPNGVLANALDYDDGHRLTKGHPGATVIPAVLAVAQHVDASSEQFVDAVIVADEIAVRTGIALHGSSSTYFATGAWAAVGAAAGAARLLGLDGDGCSLAIALAEYHAPRSSMLRVTRHPAMTKDAVAWGTHVGVTAAFHAAQGFTASPATVEEDTVMGDLGERWRLAECYVKAHPCCRWTHAALRAGQELLPALAGVEIERVEVVGFGSAGELARLPRPRDTEEAQYSLVWPVARLLRAGGFGPEDLTPESLADEATARLAARVELVVDRDLDAAFPARTLSALRVWNSDGRLFESGVHAAAGDADDPAWEAIVAGKVRAAREQLRAGVGADGMIIDLLREMEHAAEDA